MFGFEFTAWSATIVIVIFTIVFIAMDEYVAKPIRRRRLEKRKATDPEAKRLLDIAEKAHADQARRGDKL